MAVPPGKQRLVSRSFFTIAADARLAYLVGMPCPLNRRRNPQATIELRDLPGAEILTKPSEVPATGTVRLGDYVLTVVGDGRAELRVPAGSAVTVAVG